MTAAVLCPGPSLATTHPGPAGYDLTIGVNRAGAAFPVGIFAALDWPIARDLWPRVIARTWLTCAASAASLARRGLSGRSVVAVESLDGFCPVPRWRLYTAPAAAVYATWRGAGTVNVYGCDLAGGVDWDGAVAGENRTADRWARERAVWHDVAAWLAGRGVALNRINPPCVSSAPSSPCWASRPCGASPWHSPTHWPD